MEEIKPNEVWFAGKAEKRSSVDTCWLPEFDSYADRLRHFRDTWAMAFEAWFSELPPTGQDHALRLLEGGA